MPSLVEASFPIGPITNFPRLPPPLPDCSGAVDILWKSELIGNTVHSFQLISSLKWIRICLQVLLSRKQKLFFE